LEMGSWWTICPGWPQTKILLISASQVVRIIGMYHCAQLWLLLLRTRYLNDIIIICVGDSVEERQVYLLTLPPWAGHLLKFSGGQWLFIQWHLPCIWKKREVTRMQKAK
jgi:hypothetical protein